MILSDHCHSMQFIPERAAALAQLDEFLPRAGRAYAANRNHDDGVARQNVSQLSPWLHAGLISEAEVIAATLAQHNSAAAEKFIAEVFWRIYFKGYLEQRPGIWRTYCEGRDAAFARMEGNVGLQTAYTNAVEGSTGIDAFDHWARELVGTGYLHNHARMWFASIWIFTLRLDWELGADFFLRNLIDGDAASNTLNWRWVGGLHTKGKTYIAREDNIARYTANHPDGPLTASGLASKAPALEDAEDHPRTNLDLPGPPDRHALAAPYALILHDEAASHVPLDLPAPPALIIGAARPDARSPMSTAPTARNFAIDAVRNGISQAASAYGCDAHEWSEAESLDDILGKVGVDRIAVPMLPTGWTHDSLQPELAALVAADRATILLGDLQRATWPQARAGFFGVRKQIATIIAEVGLG